MAIEIKSVVQFCRQSHSGPSFLHPHPMTSSANRMDAEVTSYLPGHNIILYTKDVTDRDTVQNNARCVGDTPLE